MRYSASSVSGQPQIVDTVFLTIIGVASTAETDILTSKVAFVGVDEDGQQTVLHAVIIHHLHDLLRSLPVLRFAGQLGKVFHLQLETRRLCCRRCAAVIMRRDAFMCVKVHARERNARLGVIGCQQPVRQVCRFFEVEIVAQAVRDRRQIRERGREVMGSKKTAQHANGSFESVDVVVLVVIQSGGYPFSGMCHFLGQVH